MTDWSLVAAGAAAMVAGLLFFRFAGPISAAQKSLMRAWRYPRAVQEAMTPSLVRAIGGIGCLVWGLAAVVVGGFFADILEEAHRSGRQLPSLATLTSCPPASSARSASPVTTTSTRC